MKNKTKKYCIVFALVLILSACIGRLVFQGQEKQQVQLTVVLPRGSEQETSALMEGVRDCAQEYDIQMQVLYGAAWTQQQWEKTIQEEQTLGSKGILLLYPERFLSISRTDEQAYAAMPVLCCSDEPYTCFPFQASFDRTDVQPDDVVSDGGLTAEQMTAIQSGSLRGVWVPNWYQLGYRSAQKLYFHAAGSAMESVQADMLWVSKQALDAGTYDALLGE